MKLCNKSYCTCFWDKFLNYNLVPCCKLHDFNYGKQHIERNEADKYFYKCLKKQTFFLLALTMYGVVRTFGWYRWNKATRKNIRYFILNYAEMEEWYSNSDNHYLGELDGDIFHVTPFVCDFQLVRDKEIVLKGVAGQGLGYDLRARTFIIMEGK